MSNEFDGGYIPALQIRGPKVTDGTKSGHIDELRCNNLMGMVLKSFKVVSVEQWPLKQITIDGDVTEIL